MVRAGQFKSVKVVTQVLQNGAKLKKTYWYADGVGLVKGMIESENFSSTSELIKYTLKK
ncbi:hypothetical protein [Gloeothece verrucosa]|uniref:Uncharacterized protein n=1 Tax=Gloeothece verrucosa (strain PCC 7822) TaxID=497965 RepID=E0UN69_GLOV7|nr:hypothetical protein [Gloeothece verrucosa]ADN18399.1 conserved hypothetical protein [Gloeothece verrucosa PCC 7822]